MARSTISIRSLSCLALFLTSSILPRPALGQVSVAIIDVELEGELGPEVLEQVARSLEAGVRTAALSVVTPDVVAERLIQAGMSSRCDSEPCLTEVGPLTGVEALLRARVSQTGQYYSVGVELLLAQDGSRLGAAEATCDVCTWDEAREAITRCAEEIRHDLPAIVLFTHLPPGGVLTVDGQPRSTDGEVLLRPGAHVVEVTAEGAEPSSREITIPPGERVEISLRRHGGRGGRALGLWGWLLGGLGVGALIPGAVLLALDGACAEQVGGGCLDRYETGAAGLAVTLTGAALTLTSLVLLAVHYGRRLGERRRQRGADSRPRFAAELGLGFTSASSLPILDSW